MALSRSDAKRLSSSRGFPGSSGRRLLPQRFRRYLAFQAPVCSGRRAAGRGSIRPRSESWKIGREHGHDDAADDDAEEADERRGSMQGGQGAHEGFHPRRRRSRRP